MHTLGEFLLGKALLLTDLPESVSALFMTAATGYYVHNVHIMMFWRQ